MARDTSEATNYAIGVLALNDETTGGTVNTPGDAAPFQYIIHSPDPEKYPLPKDLHEAQLFSIGGDGISDVAFYAHPEAYFRILYGNSASIDSLGQVFITYHAMDRRKKRDISFSLIPFLETNKPNHIEVQELPGVDYIGSSIALWGRPDSTALLDVIENIVLAEGLPHPTINGKWVKDPARYIPDVSTSGNQYDSTISYTSQLGFKAIHANDLPMYKPDRGNNGFIDGADFKTEPFKFSTGNKSHKKFTDVSNPLGILMGRHTIATSLAQGTKDASPIPNDSLCYQQKRILMGDISASDTLIEVNDSKYLDEIASWEGHSENLNMIKIGKELIHYLGVSKTPPYLLQNVTRAYWGTDASSHNANDRRTDEAEKVFEEQIANLEKTLESDVRPNYLAIAQIYAFTGNKDKALKNLLKSVEQGLGFVDFILIDPFFESLREDSEFKSIVQQAQEEKAALRAQVREMEERGELTL